MKFFSNFFSFFLYGSFRRTSKLSNALGFIKKYEKLASLRHFEIFLSLLVWAQKVLFGPKCGLLRLFTHEKSSLWVNFKMVGAREFSIFFAQNFKSKTFDTILKNWRGHPLQMSRHTHQAHPLSAQLCRLARKA